MLTAVRTPAIEIAYEESGPETGTLVVLLHGFPRDARAYDATREAARP
jgi:pimeloyl-ACP methyl ester carboxylesterase